MENVSKVRGLLVVNGIDPDLTKIFDLLCENEGGFDRTVEKVFREAYRQVQDPQKVARIILAVFTTYPEHVSVLQQKIFRHPGFVTDSKFFPGIFLGMWSAATVYSVDMEEFLIFNERILLHTSWKCEDIVFVEISSLLSNYLDTPESSEYSSKCDLLRKLLIKIKHTLSNSDNNLPLCRKFGIEISRCLILSKHEDVLFDFAIK